MGKKNLRDEIKKIWNKNAQWWDNKIGDGNLFQDVLIEPHTLDLLDIQPDDCILDIACGAGRLTRKIAAKCLSVTAFDLAPKGVEKTKRFSEKVSVEVDFR